MARVCHIHIELRVGDVRNGHQEAEQTDMVAEECRNQRDLHVPAHDGIVRREVARPEEALVAQLDGRREEHKERDEDRHLQQHRDTAAHRAGSCAAIEFHDGALTIHGLLLLGILSVDFFHLRTEDAHLRRRHVRLVGQRQKDELHEYCHPENNPSVVAHETAEEVKQRDDKVLVHPAEDSPTEGDKLLQVWLLDSRKVVVIVVEQGELVRTEEETEIGCLRAFQVEGDRSLRGEVLHVFAILIHV